MAEAGNPTEDEIDEARLNELENGVQNVALFAIGAIGKIYGREGFAY